VTEPQGSRSRAFVIRALVPLAAIVLVSLPAAAAADSRPITKLESRRLPPAAVTRRVLDQLGDILLPSLVKPGRRRPVRPLQSLWFFTRPHATGQIGVCATSLVVFDLRPAQDSEENDAATLVKVADVSATPRFYLARPIDPNDARDMRPDQHRTAEQVCGRLDPRKKNFFRAANEGDAVRGVWAYNATVRAAQGLAPSMQLTCPYLKNCMAVIAKSTLRDIEQIEPCDGPSPDVLCTSIQLNLDSGGGVDLSVYSKGPAQPISAKIEEVFVSTHELID
jgi:hypothetical protein